MGLLKKLFSRKPENKQQESMIEQREVTFHVGENLVGKEGMSDPTVLQGMFLKFINEKSDQIDSEVMDLITSKSLSIKNVNMTITDGGSGTDVTYLIEFNMTYVSFYGKL